MKMDGEIFKNLQLPKNMGPLLFVAKECALVDSMQSLSHRVGDDCE